MQMKNKEMYRMQVIDALINQTSLEAEEIDELMTAYEDVIDVFYEDNDVLSPEDCASAIIEAEGSGSRMPKGFGKGLHEASRMPKSIKNLEKMGWIRPMTKSRENNQNDEGWQDDFRNASALAKALETDGEFVSKALEEADFIPERSDLNDVIEAQADAFAAKNRHLIEKEGIEEVVELFKEFIIDTLKDLYSK